MFSIQRMNMEHAHFLFEWRNDEVTRTNSFSSEKIEWEAHVSWIERKAKEPEHHLIFFSGSTPVGRFSLDSDFEISILVSPEKRGQGIGTRMLKQAIEYLRSRNVRETLRAYIKTENKPSIRMFSAAGFRQAEAEVQLHGSKSLLFLLDA